jgi:hypothetical protein
MFKFLLLSLLYIALAAAWAWRLRPAPVVEDLRTPRIERLTTYLIKVPRETAQPILMSIAFLADDRLAQADHWLGLSPMQQLRELTVRDSPMLHNSGSLRDALLLGWLGQDDKGISHAEAHLMIAASGDRFDDIMRLYAYETLATRARSQNDLETAMDILERAIDTPGAKWHLTRTYIQIARERNQPSAALTSVSEWLKTKGKNATADELEEARELQTHYLLRLHRSEEALSIHLDHLSHTQPQDPGFQTTLNHALMSARTCGQPTQVLPWIEKLLSTYPEHKLPPDKLLTHTETNPEYSHWLREYAALADGALPQHSALDACLRLVASGEPSALARICTLAEESKRSTQAIEFLSKALAHPALSPTLHTLAQSTPLARRVVTEALHQEPKKRDLHFSATLAEAAAKPGSASSLWQAYLKRFPSDTAAARRLILSHLAARQPDRALRVFEDLDPKLLTEADRRQRDLLNQL